MNFSKNPAARAPGKSWAAATGTFLSSKSDSRDNCDECPCRPALDEQQFLQ
jgi:hypothetical protein